MRITEAASIWYLCCCQPGKGKSFLDSRADILENCLFIIWRHLEYYLLRCVPADQQPLAFQSVAHRQQQMRRLQGKQRYGGEDSSVVRAPDS